MNRIFIAAVMAAALSHAPAMAQETPSAMVSAYEALADTILSVKRAEADFVRALLDGYRHGALAAYEQGNYKRAGAYMALFANEGGNAIAGIRKRLVDGGHHHHASDEDSDAYDAGFVIVDKATKASLLAVAAQMRAADGKADAGDAWGRFDTATKALLAAE